MAKAAGEERLDIGLEQVQRVLQTQLTSIDTIQTKIGVLLGFAATSLVILFSLGQAWAKGHLLFSGPSAVALLAAISIFAGSMMIEDWTDSPRPSWLAALINDQKNSLESVKEQIIGDLWGAYDKNSELIAKRFRMVNAAVVLMIIGTGIFVVGVLIS